MFKIDFHDTKGSLDSGRSNCPLSFADGRRHGDIVE